MPPDWDCATTPPLVLYGWMWRRHLIEGRVSTEFTSSTSPSGKPSEIREQRTATPTRTGERTPQLYGQAVVVRGAPDHRPAAAADPSPISRSTNRARPCAVGRRDRRQRERARWAPVEDRSARRPFATAYRVGRLRTQRSAGAARNCGSRVASMAPLDL